MGRKSPVDKAQGKACVSCVHLWPKKHPPAPPPHLPSPLLSSLPPYCPCAGANPVFHAPSGNTKGVKRRMGGMGGWGRGLSLMYTCHALRYPLGYCLRPTCLLRSHRERGTHFKNSPFVLSFSQGACIGFSSVLTRFKRASHGSL